MDVYKHLFTATDQSVLQKIASPFLEIPMDFCAGIVGGSEIILIISNVFVFPLWVSVNLD